MKTKAIFLFVSVCLFAGDIFAQCAMCRKMAGDVTEEVDSSIGQQLNSGILYLLVIPYIILFLVFRKKIRSFFRELRSAGRE